MHVWFALVLIALTAALFVAAYWLLFRAVQERDREVVRAQFYVYRTWYQEGGLPALIRQFSELHDSGRELFSSVSWGRSGPVCLSAFRRGSRTSICGNSSG